MSQSPERLILVDPCKETRDVLQRRLLAQGYLVEAVDDAATGADLALSAPPAAVIADLWMPSVSGVQLCRLLRAEAATADVPVILRGETDDPRSRFWAERAGAAAYVANGRMGELVRSLAGAIAKRPPADDFFMQLSGGSMDIRDRIARHLDKALFDSVIAAEVRALANCGSFDRLFDLFSQFLSQVLGYRWLALVTHAPDHLAIHHDPTNGAEAEREARLALAVRPDLAADHVEDEDARGERATLPAIVRDVLFGGIKVGAIALGPSTLTDANADELLTLVAREFGGPIRMTALIEESQRLASIDPLTGLMNRRAFGAAVGIETARAHRYAVPLSLLVLDVDHFKSINDQRGHAGGDRVLAALGRVLRETLRLPDLTARWGGEEFVAVLTHTNQDGGVLAAERVRRAIEELIVLDGDGERIPITVSVGVARLESGERIEPVVERADRAMYAAKIAGRNRVAVLRSGQDQPEVVDLAVAQAAERGPAISRAS